MAVLPSSWHVTRTLVPVLEKVKTALVLVVELLGLPVILIVGAPVARTLEVAAFDSDADPASVSKEKTPSSTTRIRRREECFRSPITVGGIGTRLGDC